MLLSQSGETIVGYSLYMNDLASVLTLTKLEALADGGASDFKCWYWNYEEVVLVFNKTSGFVHAFTLDDFSKWEELEHFINGKSLNIEPGKDYLI